MRQITKDIEINISSRLEMKTAYIPKEKQCGIIASTVTLFMIWDIKKCLDPGLQCPLDCLQPVRR